MINIDDYRAQVEEFLYELDLAYYEHYSGLKSTPEMAAAYEGHKEIFGHRIASDLMSAAKARPELLESARFAVSALCEEAVKDLDDVLALAESEGTVQVEGTETPFRSSASVLANESSRDTRWDIESVRRVFISERLDPIAAAAHHKTQEMARSLGFADYLDLCAYTTGTDFDVMSAQVNELISATDALYPRALESALQERLGISLDKLERSDMPYLFRAIEFDHLFPGDRMLGALQETLAGLGIDLESQLNVLLDIEARELKSPRAFCAPVRVPDDVRLVIMPIGGHDDYQALFHEAGHAEHYAHTDGDLTVEARRMGDNAVTEGFAFLFEYLLHDEAWLRSVGRVDDPTDYLRFAGLTFAYYIRRYGAKFRYESRLHRSGPSETMALEYSRQLSESTLIPYPASGYMTDVDPGMYCTCYLRAWLFESELKRIMRSRFGAEWFLSRQAGDFLKDLWSKGQSMRAEELLAYALGEEGPREMSCRFVIEDIKTLLDS